MNRSLAAVLCAFLFALAFIAPGVTAQTKVEGTRPNIVLIVSDDMGWGEPGYNGGNLELTPHMDRLRSQGVRMTQFYAHSVCSPTRAAIMTGRYAFRTWMDWRSEDFGKPSYLKKLGLTLAKNERGEETRRIHALDTDERTVAEALKEAGYFTAICGKWHLGEWLPENLPMGQGFMHQYGHYAWGIDYLNYTIPHNAPARYAVYDWHRNQQPIAEQGYTTDLIGNEVVRLLSEQKKDRPFFFYVTFNAVHGPIEEVPRYTDKYTRRQAALKCLDDAIGRIVGAVDQNGFAENTLIFCTNDNGAVAEEFNRPYSGTKNTTYEGGVRMPCVVRWPGHIKPGTENEGLMHVVDLMPTFVALAGGSMKQEKKVDGMNMCDMIFGPTASPRHEIIFEVTGSVRVPTIRVDDYKLMGTKLFDIVKDPTESKDVAGEHQDLVKKMAARLEEAGKERPPLGNKPLLMTPALPYVYGIEENKHAPQWLIETVEAVRATQPKEWAPGETPWPQAPEGDTIIYKGDGR